MDTERELSANAAAGDAEAFGQLVRLYRDPVYRMALRMTGNEPDARDLSQTAFVRAFENLDKYDPERPFFSWIFTVALNVVRDFLRKRSADRSFSQFSEGIENRRDDDGGRNPEESLLGKEREAVLQKGLMRLPLALREAVLLRFMEGLPFRDIASVLGVSEGAAKMRVYRGLQRLRRDISRIEKDVPGG